MKKRILTMLLAMMMMFAFASVAMADTGDFTITGGTEDTDYTYSEGVLTIIGTGAVSIANADINTATSDIIVVDVAGANITLNGVNMSSTGSPITINEGASATITVTGENTVASTGASYSTAGIDSEGALTIKGDGTLNVSGYRGIYMDGDFTIEGSVNVTVTGSETPSPSGSSFYYPAAIYNKSGDITISSSGNFATSGYIGIYNSYETEIAISITAGTSNISGLYSAINVVGGSVSISDGANVEINCTGTDNSSTTAMKGVSYTQSGEATKVTVNATATAVSFTNVTLTDGELTITCETYNNGNGISGGTIAISDAKLTITSAWNGISGTDITLTDSDVNITTNYYSEGGKYHGITGTNITITGGTTDITTTEGTGIYASNSTVINSGTIKVDASNPDGGYIYGVYGGSTLTINEVADVFIKTKTSGNALACGTDATVTIDNMMMLTFSNALAYNEVVLTPSEGETITYDELTGYYSIAFSGPDVTTDYTVTVNDVQQQYTISTGTYGETFTATADTLNIFSAVCDITPELGTIEIGTADELITFATDFNADKYADYAKLDVILTDDIDMDGKTLVSIGDSSTAFSGTFDGQGYIIKNVEYSDGVDLCVGIFGQTSYATVENLNVQGTVSFTGSATQAYMGGIVGYATNSTISNCTADVTYDQTTYEQYIYWGGIAGYVGACDVIDCVATGSFETDSSIGCNTFYAGGIAAVNEASLIQNCYTDIDANIGKVSYWGGIVGTAYNYSEIDNCYALGNITIDGGSYVGGIAGKVNSNSSITNCYYSGTLDGALSITHQGAIVGGTTDSPTNSNNFYPIGTTVTGTIGSVASYDMTTSDFCDEIVAGGGIYIYEEGKTPQFPHDLEYSVSGNTISVLFDGAVVGTVYISAPTGTTAYGDTVNLGLYATGIGATGSLSYTITKDGADYNVAFNSDFTEAGVYVVELIMTVDDTDYTATSTFTISKAPVTFTVTGNSFKVGEYSVPTITPSVDTLTDTDYTVTYQNSKGEIVTLSDETPAGTYTIVVTMINTNYKVSGTVGSVVVWEDEQPATYSLTYDENGGGDVTDPTNAIATTVRTLETPTYTDHTFAGWSYDGKIYAAGAEFVQPAENVTLTAIWVANTFTVSGTVTDKYGNLVSDATVTLAGTTTDTTNANGEFLFDNVAMGEYNIVASKGNVSTTTYVYVTENTTVNKILLDFSLTTSVEVADDVTATSADMTKIVEAVVASETYENGDNVEIELVVATSNDTEAETAIAEKTDDIVYVLDITVKEILNDTTVTNISETDDLIAITIDLPAELQGMATYKVYRYHDGEVDVISTTKNSEGEYIEVNADKTQITIHAKYFSTYAVAVSDVIYSVSYTYYDIDLTTTGEGSITPTGGDNATITTVKGGSRMFTFTPADGYEIDDVIVDGVSVGAVETYYFSSISSDHTLEVVFATEDGSVDTSLNAMDEDAYYYNAILWAIEEGMIVADDEDLDTILNGSTRADSVYYMWIAYGSPVVDIENPFTDIDTDDYYYNAVLWAYSVDITAGTTTTTFSPDVICTRAHIASFIYRAAGEIEVETGNDFTDVNTEAYYANAVNWAVDEEIVAGMTTSTFEPNTDCARTHILTFLYRYLA